MNGCKRAARPLSTGGHVRNLCCDGRSRQGISRCRGGDNQADECSGKSIENFHIAGELFHRQIADKLQRAVQQRSHFLCAGYFPRRLALAGEDQTCPVGTHLFRAATEQLAIELLAELAAAGQIKRLDTVAANLAQLTGKQLLHFVFRQRIETGTVAGDHRKLGTGQHRQREEQGSNDSFHHVLSPQKTASTARRKTIGLSVSMPQMPVAPPAASDGPLKVLCVRTPSLLKS